jgi:hypothetical protein
MKRRHFLGAGALLAQPLAARSAASDWEQRLGYPSGWGPSRSWTDKAYRVGNYSGGYEAMFRARPIAAAPSPVPLGVLSAEGTKVFEPVAIRAQTYMRPGRSAGCSLRARARCCLRPTSLTASRTCA